MQASVLELFRKSSLILMPLVLCCCLFAACGGSDDGSVSSASASSASSALSGASNSAGSGAPGNHTVIFDSNGANVQASPTYKLVNAPATTVDALPAPPAKAGNIFVGWNTDRDGNGTPFTESTQVTASIIVYAQWTADSGRIVIFDGNGADMQASPTYKIVVVPATTVDALPAPPTRAGYAFAGWNTDQNGGGSAFEANTPVTANVIVYAQWTLSVYTVSFNKNNTDPGATDANPATITVTLPATTVGALPAPPERAGYVFVGWNVDPNGSGSPFTAATAVTASIPVYAQWAAAGGHIVIFDGNGADVQANPLTKTVFSPATTVVTLPAPPTRIGHTFADWYTTQDVGGTQFTASTTVTAGITVYARWTINSYTITFNKNNTDAGGTDANPLTKTADHGAAMALPAQPTRPGYTFAGWNTAPNGSGSPFTAATPVTASILVYAQWTSNASSASTVTFSKNNTDPGSTDAIPATKTVTAPATTVGALPATEPTRPGHVFVGWNTAANGSGTPFTASTTVTGSIEVYAQWVAFHTITFNKNNTDPGSTDANPLTKTVIAPAVNVGTLPAPPVRAQYVFAGWNTTANGSGTAFTAGTTVTADRTVYAQWDRDLTDTHVTLLSVVGTTAGSQNVRAEPSASASIVYVLTNGYVHVTKIDPVSTWLVIEYARNQIAYTSMTVNVTTAVLTSRVGKALANKYVYAAASTAAKLGVIREGSFVLTIDKPSSGWYRIVYDGRDVGYVTADDVLIPKGVITASANTPYNVSVSNKASSNNPGKLNRVGGRGPDAYNQVINQFNVGQNTANSSGGYSTTTYNARYNQTRNSTGGVTATYCNIFNWDVMTAMGVHFPHWAQPNGSFITPVSGWAQVQTPYIPPPGTTTGTAGLNEVNANMLYEWMRKYGVNYGWTEVTATFAQNRANNGFPTVTVHRNNSDSSSGHVQVVRPESGSYVYSSANSCVVAQAGSSNFNYGNVRTAYSSGIPTTSSHTYALKYYTHDSLTINGGSDTYNQPEVAGSVHPSDTGM